MRDKFRLYLLLHEKPMFRLMVAAVCLLIGWITIEVARDPVEEFLSGRSSRLDGYGSGY